MTVHLPTARSARTARTVFDGGPLDGRDELVETRTGRLPFVVSMGWPDADEEGLGVYELARLADGVGYYGRLPSRRRPGRKDEVGPIQSSVIRAGQAATRPR